MNRCVHCSGCAQEESVVSVFEQRARGSEGAEKYIRRRGGSFYCCFDLLLTVICEQMKGEMFKRGEG